MISIRNPNTKGIALNVDAFYFILKPKCKQTMENGERKRETRLPIVLLNSSIPIHCIFLVIFYICTNAVAKTFWPSWPYSAARNPIQFDFSLVVELRIRLIKHIECCTAIFTLYCTGDCVFNECPPIVGRASKRCHFD